VTTPDYSKMSREALIAELESGRRTSLAAARTLDSINLLDILNAAQTNFITVDSDRNIFNQMLDNFLEVTGCNYGFIDELFTREDGYLWLEARAITNIAWDEGSRGLFEKILSGEIVFDNLNSLYGVVMKTGEPFFSNDAPNDPQRTGVPPGHPALTSFLGLPLHAGGEFVGVLGLANAPGGFSEETIERLQPLTRICAIIMQSFKIDQQRARAQEHLARKVEELARSNAELEQFAYVASHDLQEPLRTVSSFSQLLARRYRGELDEKADKYIDFITDGAQRMSMLIDHLLRYSRVGSQGRVFEPVDLGVTMERVQRDLSGRLSDTGGRLTVGPLPVVRGDGRQLAEVLRNLVSNALKFCGEATPEVAVGAERADSDGWRISVADNGIGIPSEQQERIFEMFHRLHSRDKYDGTGIGLALVRKIIERHGGEISLTSNPGAGTTMRFTLPDDPGSGGTSG